VRRSEAPLPLRLFVFVERSDQPQRIAEPDAKRIENGGKN
jgi:hypothetical protein